MKNCPICNAPLEDNAVECTFCGTRVATQQTATPNPATPTATPSVTPDLSSFTIPLTQPTEDLPKKANGKPLGKMKYLLSAAPLKTRIMTFVLLGLALACVVFILTTSSSIQNRDFTKIGIIDMVFSEEDIADFNDEREELLDEIDDLMDEDDDDRIDEFEEEIGMDIEEARKLVENFSLKAMVILLEADGESEEVVAAYNAFLASMTVAAVFSAVLVVLASLLGWTWLVIVNYIFSILYYLLLAGFGSFIVASVLFIALAVVMSKQNKTYKKYKKSVLGLL